MKTGTFEGFGSPLGTLRRDRLRQRARDLHVDAVLHYPQSAEPIAAGANSSAPFAEPQEPLYGAAHTRGRRSLGHLFVLTYDGLLSYSHIMDFKDRKVALGYPVLRRPLRAGGLARSMGRTICRNLAMKLCGFFFSS